MVESGDAGRSEARLRERCGVGCAAERRNPALLTGDIKLLSSLHKQVGDIFIRLDRAVEVAVVGHKILGIMNRIIREDEGRDIVELALMSRAPRLCAAQTRFLGAGEDNADFGVLKLDALFLESLEDGYAHIAAGKVVVRAVNDAVLVPHPIKADKERDEHETNEAKKSEGLVCIERDILESVLCYEHYGNDKIIDSADAADNCVTLKADTAELIVDRPLPCGIRMAVEEYAALDFALAALDCGDVMSGLFGEEAIDKLLIESELHKDYKQTDDDKNYRDERIEERNSYRRENEGNREIYPAEERTGVLFERLDVGSLASALVFQYVRHILTCLLLALGAGIAFFEVLAYVGYLAHHILGRFFLLVND